jgi:hypothetical protein
MRELRNISYKGLILILFIAFINSLQLPLSTQMLCNIQLAAAEEPIFSYMSLTAPGFSSSNIVTSYTQYASYRQYNYPLYNPIKYPTLTIYSFLPEVYAYHYGSFYMPYIDIRKIPEKFYFSCQGIGESTYPQCFSYHYPVIFQWDTDGLLNIP